LNESVYLHGTSEEEQRRLSLMNDVLLNNTALREMALRGDERIIDFASGLGQFARAMARAVPRGHVVGIEKDPNQLAQSIKLANADKVHVDFRHGDVLALDLPREEWGTYDVAHARFILEHVRDPLKVVQTMVKTLKPGGRIILADDDHDVMRLWPEPVGFNDLWRAYMRTYERIGNDPFVGRRLVELLHRAGAEPRRNNWIFFGGCAGMQNFDVLTANMISIVRGARDAILSMSLFERNAFERVVREYETWAQRPDAAMWFAVAWAEGARP
jgi:SAM-dependent methyltransferase